MPAALNTGVAPVKVLVRFSPKLPGPVKPDVRPARPPEIKPDLRESLMLAPPIKDPMPLPKKLAPKVPAPNAGPKNGTPKAAAAIGSTIGASFFATLTTLLTAFLTALNTLLKKNSGRPVSGFMLLSSLPTTNSCGSRPISSICLKRSSLILGFLFRTSNGMTVSPSAA